MTGELILKTRRCSPFQDFHWDLGAAVCELLFYSIIIVQLTGSISYVSLSTLEIWGKYVKSRDFKNSVSN